MPAATATDISERKILSQRQDSAVIIARAAKAAGFELLLRRICSILMTKLILRSMQNEATEKLVRAGILHGDETGHFKPKDNCTRAQAAVMLTNVLEQYEAMEG